MNEISKTGVFAGVAGLLCLLAYVTETKTSTNIESEAQERVGEPLFPEFTKPLDVATLKLVKYNEDLGQIQPFEVVKDKTSGVWTLPSHYSYPADAQNQLSNAANSLIGVKILALASSRADDQRLYGVIEPNVDKLEVGESGVGQLVRMQNDKGGRLADLIIGKPVKDAENQRYVRIPTNDQIYIAEIDPKVFTTEFKQWINQDLLQLSSTDIRELYVRDYDIIVARGMGQMSRQFEAQLAFNTEDGKWSANKLIDFRNGAETPRALAENEELNTTKLNAIKTALDALQIEDVARKPEGLAADLKADQALLNDKISIESLIKKGFFPQQAADGNTELFASSGELLVSLKDGVQYLLRFGNAADSTLKDTEEATDGAEAKSTDILSINRYLLVTARLDESQIPAAIIEPVPQSVEEMEAMQAAAEPPASSPSKQTDPAPATAPEPAISEPVSSESEDAVSADSETDAVPTSPSDSESPSNSSEPAGAPEATPPSTDDQSKSATRSATRLVAFQDDQSVEEPIADTATEPSSEDSPAVADESAAPVQPPASKEETAQEKQERLEALQEKLTKSNQRKLDERSDKLSKAKKRVAELNARFAEWYYVIGESQYEKLSVTFEELVVNKDAAKSPAFSMPPNNGGDLDFGGFQN